MADYRAYFIKETGRIAGRADLVCDSDEEAIEQARRLLDGMDIEVWLGSRPVRRLNWAAKDCNT